VFAKTSKHLSSINSGHIELILILAILELSSKYCNSSASLDSTPPLAPPSEGGGFFE